MTRLPRAAPGAGAAPPHHEDVRPTLQLRATSIIREATSERGATILIPTAMVDAMNPAVAMALAGRAADGGGKA